MSESTSTGPAGTIVFKEIPTPWLVPGSKQEIITGNQNAGGLGVPARTLIIGGLTSGGSATTATLVPNVTRALDGRGFGGPGSHIDRMVSAYLASPDQSVPLDVICLADAGGAAAAVWTYTFAGTATANGLPAVGIEGQRISVGTVSGDTAAIAATEFAAAITAGPQAANVTDTAQLPVTASVTGAVVTVTARNKGVCGNDISHVVSPAPGDAMPAGLTLTIAQTVQGTTNPSISAALSLVANTLYSDIAIAWQDTTNLGLAKAESERRFNAMIHLDTRVHFGCTGTFSQQIAAIAAVNGRFIYASPFTAPGSAPWAIAAAAAGACAKRLSADPSQQLNQIALPTIVGPQVANLRSEVEKGQLLAAGGSVFHVHSDGTVLMQRYVSTNTTDANGNLDMSWRDVMAQAVSSQVRSRWRAYFQSLYPSNKLAPDGSLAAQFDTTVCTPIRAKASWAAFYTSLEKVGWLIDGVNQIKAASFLIDPNDPNRLDYRIPYKRIGNLIVDAGQIVMNVGTE